MKFFSFLKYFLLSLMSMLLCVLIPLEYLSFKASFSNDGDNYIENGPTLKQVALNDPVGTFWALWVMDETQTIAIQNKLYGRKFEKFRHTYFSAKLTQKIGPVRCKKFTDAYERFVPNPKFARDYDLENNRIGRSLSNQKDLKNYILKLIEGL